jgi:hypothetical protein
MPHEPHLSRRDPGPSPRTQGEGVRRVSAGPAAAGILKYPRYDIPPLGPIDGRRKETKARKKAMAGVSAAGARTPKALAAERIRRGVGALAFLAM